MEKILTIKEIKEILYNTTISYERNIAKNQIKDILDKENVFFENDELDKSNELLEGLLKDLDASNPKENKAIKNLKSRIFYSLGCIYHMKNDYKNAIKRFEKIDNNNVIKYMAIIESYISDVSYNIIFSTPQEYIEKVIKKAEELPGENTIQYGVLIINLIKCYKVLNEYYDIEVDKNKIDKKIQEIKNIPGLKNSKYYECLAENSDNKYEITINYEKAIDLIVEGMFNRDKYNSLQIRRRIIWLHRYDKAIELIESLLENIDDTPENIDDIYKYEMLKAQIYSRYEEYKEAKDTLITLRAKKEDASLIFSLWGLYLKLKEDKNRRQMLDIFRDKYGEEHPEVLKIIDEIEAENTKDSGGK